VSGKKLERGKAEIETLSFTKNDFKNFENETVFYFAQVGPIKSDFIPLHFWQCIPGEIF